MKRNNIISVIAFLLLCLIVAGSLASCGAEGGKEQQQQQQMGESEGALSADEAYQSAISAEEGEECTSDECTVNLYDDDGECPYNVLSPLGAVSNP